jgi:hypothetical protein
VMLYISRCEALLGLPITPISHRGADVITTLHKGIHKIKVLECVGECVVARALGQ